MKVALTLATICALLLCSSALSFDEDIVDTDNLLYDAIFDNGKLLHHFKLGLIPTIKAKVACVEDYMQQDYNTLRAGGEKVLQCIHTTQDEMDRVKNSTFAQMQAQNFKDVMQACQQKIGLVSKRLDCYAEAVAVYSKLVDWIQAPYVKQTKMCVHYQLLRIEAKLLEAGETFTLCVDEANAGPAPPVSEPQIDDDFDSIESSSTED